MDIVKASSEIEQEEDRVPWAYKESLGYWTIGVGFLIDKLAGGKLYDEEITFILNNRVTKAYNDIKDMTWFKDQDSIRQRALVNMAYQLGLTKLLAFKNSLHFIELKDYVNAGVNLRQSMWYKQTPVRAERVIKMIETGVTSYGD